MLAEMQARISESPHVALGIAEATATPESVRAAFLELTKQFHPARFGRMSTELQRLSNEVFLGIKAAHEQLLRGLGVAPRGSWMNNQSGGMPVVSAEGTNRTMRFGTVQPRALGTEQPTRPQPAIPRTLTPTQHGFGAARPVTPAFGARVVTARPGTPPQSSSPVSRPSTPLQTRPVTPSGSRPSTPNASPPADSTATRGTTGDWQQLQRTTGAFDERAELQQVLGALAQKNWSTAKTLLNGLAARVPASKQYRALIAYTRGREAQSAGRGEDAVMEFQRALQLDPDLQQAKSAMAELLRRR